MLTKLDLIEAKETYDKKRSPCKLGLFLAIMEFCSNIPFYSALKSFIETDLNKLKWLDTLSADQLKKLKLILRVNTVFPNTFNQEIIELHDHISELVRTSEATVSTQILSDTKKMK